MLGLLLLLIPAVSAGGIAHPANQTHITEIRDRIMNNSHVTEVRMQGAIQYIDQISNGSGTTALTATRDNYVSVAASILSLQNGTELRTTGMDLRQIEHLFFNQTKTAVKTYNGTPSGLKQSIKAALVAAGLSEKECGSRPDHAPGFAGNETDRPDHAPNFAGNTTDRPDHVPGSAVKGTSHGAGNGTSMPGNGSAGGHNRGVNVTVN